MPEKIADPLQVNEMDGANLQVILTLSEDERLLYINNLIKKYYPNIDFNTEVYFNIQKSYIGSFNLENIFRQSEEAKRAFTPIYTKTGLIRNIVNDLFFMPQELITH